MERTEFQSEDCLCLSVIAPVDAKNAPVMVFSHGGAYIFGAGDIDAYAAWGVASRGSSPSALITGWGYLGICRFQASQLRIWGLLDRIEALRWAQRNVGAFGGDAYTVTIFRRSTGADSIHCVLVAEGTEELFQKAILQSSPCPSRLHEANRVEMHIAMSSVAQKYLETDGYNCSVEQLLKIQAETLKEGAKYTPTLANYAPIFGSYPLPPDYELPDRIAAAAKMKPIFLGVTRDEGTPFEMVFGEEIDNADRVTKEDFLDGQCELHRQIEAAMGRPSPFCMLEWLPMLRDSGAEEDFREILERVGGYMEDMWVAFARGEDLKRRYFTIGGGFKFP